MAERFPLVVNPIYRKIEEIKETDSLELTGNGISISGNTGTSTQYLKSTGSAELEWADPFIEISIRPSFSLNNLTVNGTLTTTGTLDVGTSATVGTNLVVVNNTTIGGTLDVTSNATVGGTLETSGNLTVDGSYFVKQCNDTLV